MAEEFRDEGKSGKNTTERLAFQEVKGILDNPVYTGKIVHGRYGLEKIIGTRNEYRKVKRGQYEEYDGWRANGRDCTYNHSICEEFLDRQVVEAVQQAVDNMYVEKGLIMALGSSDDLEELSADLDKLRAEKRKAEKKKSHEMEL